MFKVVVDTNIFISALVFGGTTKDLLEFINSNHILIFSPDLILEIETKLQQKFKVSDEIIEIFREFVELSNIQVPTSKLNIVRDPQDNFLFELAQISNADIILSGDKDVLAIEKFQNTFVLSPKQFRDKFVQ